MAKRKRVSKLDKLKNHLIYSCATASMHGLIHIVRSKRTLPERLLWVAIVAACIFGIVTQAKDIWDHYRINPTVTMIEKDFTQWQQKIPSITFCQGEIPDIMDVIVRNLRKHKMIQDDFNVSNEVFSEFLSDLLLTNYSSYHKLKKYADGLVPEPFPPSEFLSLAWRVAGQFDKNEFKPFENLAFIPTENGACNIFNSEIASDISFEKLITKEPENKYSLLTRTSTSSYYSIIFRNLRSEFTVYGHSSNEIINFNTRPLFRGAKQSFSTITISVTDVVSEDALKSLYPEQRSCRYTYENENMKYYKKYSYNLCMQECRMEKVKKFCGCLPYYYAPKDPNTICTLAQTYCLSKYEEELINVTDCNCYENCDLQRVEFDSTQSGQFFLASQFKVEVSDFPKSRYIRKLMFRQTDVLVQIGGLLGLFLGCSILSVIEIFYFLIIRCYWAIWGKRDIKADI